MEYPIPQDWDGESWRRFCVCWPDSPLFLGYLRGFITYFTRGRAWDGRTGSIKDAQVIGWQIANNNLPLEEVAMSCSEANTVAKAIIILTAAITGQNIDLSEVEDLDAFLNQEFLYEQQGLANRIGPVALHNSDSSISARMDQVRAAIEALSINVNIESGTVELPGGEELVNIVTELNELGTIWETRSTAETVAQNTNFADLIAAIEALELQCQTIVETTNLNQTINCGGTTGTAGAGTWPEPESPQTTTPEDRELDPPPGFDSWSQYDTYKCDMAHLILNQMITDLSVAALLAAGGSAGAALVALLIEASLTPIGWVAWIAIGSAIVYCFVQGVEVSLLSQLILDNKGEFVCELLDGTSVSGSITNFANMVSSKVDSHATFGVLPEVIRAQIKGLIVSYATVDSINRLYEKSAVPPPGGNDCSECEESETEDYTIQLGTEVSDHPANPIVIAYEVASYGCEGNHHAQVTFSAPVTVTAINFLNGTGPCNSLYFNLYYWDTPDTTQAPFTTTNTRPQDSAPVENVRVIQSTNVWNGTIPQMQVTYTP